MEKNNSVFDVLSAINCQEYVEKKGNLSYLSWAWAWHFVKKNYPDANYKVYESENGLPYFTDGRTCMVKTSVTINGIEHTEYLPIMDNMNRSIPVEKVTSFNVNTAIQRSLTKACARHGLGLYIYAGEDLPDTMEDTPAEAPVQAPAGKKTTSKKIAYTPMDDETYWKVVAAYAEGKPTKTGGNYKDTWIATTHADKNAIAKFDNDVENYMIAHS